MTHNIVFLEPDLSKYSMQDFGVPGYCHGPIGRICYIKRPPKARKVEYVGIITLSSIVVYKLYIGD
jgi:hypothetical protein